MLSLETIPAVVYTDPWVIPLTERLRMLAAGHTRVAYFYERADNSTFRYRVYNMVQAINSANQGIAASFFFLDDLHRLQEIADLADLLVICRTRYDHRVNHLITAFRQRRKRVLFDIDDCVFNTDYAHLILSTLGGDPADPEAWQYWFSYIGRLGATLKLCDGAIATNNNLAQKIAGFANIPVSVVPNFINLEQLELSDQIYAAKKSGTLPWDGLIHLGYFSGSPSHNKDFAIVAPVLESLLEENSQLGVVVVGYIEAGARLQRFGHRVQYFPFLDFINLQRLVGSVEFNLMPLQYNEFTNCKSELKYFESAVVGTISIASPTYTYARAIRHGENGYLAQAHQWGQVIRQAVCEFADCGEMAARCREDARATFAWFNQKDGILAALGLE